MQKISALFALFALLILTACSSGTLRPLDYNEARDGDLSDERLSPTALSFALGENTLAGTSEAGDRDYFWFTVPENALLSRVVLSKYVSPDEIAFAAIQKGKLITEDPDNADASKLLGWLHLGLVHLNRNILPLLGEQDSAIGFSPPLGPGDYAFWVQQTGISTEYELKFTLE